MSAMKDRGELEALDQALDALVGRSPKSLKDLLVTFPDHSKLLMSVDSAEQAHGALAVNVSPETKAKHVAALMDAARSASGPQVILVPSKSRLPRALRPIAVLAVVASLALMPTVALAQTSEPGEALYGTKLALENLQILVTTSTEDDARLHLQFASRRLEELSALIAEGRIDEIGHVMSNFNSHTDGADEELDELVAVGSDVSELTADLAAVLQKHVTVLEGLAFGEEGAGCVEGDPESGDPQCKGLLTALENSSKVLDKHPGLDSESSNQGQGQSGEHGKPEDPGKPTQLPSEDSTPSEPGPPAGAGRP